MIAWSTTVCLVQLTQASRANDFNFELASEHALLSSRCLFGASLRIGSASDRAVACPTPRFFLHLRERIFRQQLARVKLDFLRAQP